MPYKNSLIFTYITFALKLIIDNICPYCNIVFHNELNINNHIKYECIFKNKLDYNVNAIIIEINKMVNEYNKLLYLQKYPTDNF